IACKGAQFGHDYGTDEDMSTPDPLINAFDLGNDPMQFGKERMLLAQDLLKDLADRSVDSGEDYQRTRLAFSMLMGQYGNGAYLVSRFIGGEDVRRDQHGGRYSR